MLVDSPLEVTLSKDIKLYGSHTLPGNVDEVLDALSNIIDQSQTIAAFGSNTKSFEKSRPKPFPPVLFGGLGEFPDQTEDTLAEDKGLNYPNLLEAPDPFISLAAILTERQQIPFPTAMKIIDLSTEKVLTVDTLLTEYLLVVVTGGRVILELADSSFKLKAKSYIFPVNSYFLVTAKENITMNVKNADVNSSGNPVLMVYTFKCESNDCSLSSPGGSKLNYSMFSGYIPSDILTRAQKVIGSSIFSTIGKDGEYLLNDSIPTSIREIFKLIPFPSAEEKGKDYYVDIGKDRHVYLDEVGKEFGVVALGNIKISLYLVNEDSEHLLDTFNVETGGIIIITPKKKPYTNLLRIEGPDYSLIYY